MALGGVVGLADHVEAVAEVGADARPPDRVVVRDHDADHPLTASSRPRPPHGAQSVTSHPVPGELRTSAPPPTSASRSRTDRDHPSPSAVVAGSKPTPSSCTTTMVPPGSWRSTDTQTVSAPEWRARVGDGLARRRRECLGAAARCTARIDHDQPHRDVVAGLDPRQHRCERLDRARHGRVGPLAAASGAAPEERAQLLVLLTGQRDQLCVVRAALHHCERLEHAVVQGARHLGPGLGGSSELGGRAQLCGHPPRHPAGARVEHRRTAEGQCTSRQLAVECRRDDARGADGSTPEQSPHRAHGHAGRQHGDQWPGRAERLGSVGTVHELVGRDDRRGERDVDHRSRPGDPAVLPAHGNGPHDGPDGEDRRAAPGRVRAVAARRRRRRSPRPRRPRRG